MKKQKGSYWRKLAYQRNGLLGRLTSARNACQSVQHFEGLSREDKARTRIVLLELNAILSTWDRHYIKNLRKLKEQQ